MYNDSDTLPMKWIKGSGEFRMFGSSIHFDSFQASGDVLALTGGTQQAPVAAQHDPHTACEQPVDAMLCTITVHAWHSLLGGGAGVEAPATLGERWNRFRCRLARNDLARDVDAWQRETLRKWQGWGTLESGWASVGGSWEDVGDTLGNGGIGRLWISGCPVQVPAGVGGARGGGAGHEVWQLQGLNGDAYAWHALSLSHQQHSWRFCLLRMHTLHPSFVWSSHVPRTRSAAAAAPTNSTFKQGEWKKARIAPARLD
eukprot:gene8766-biopygen6744